MGWPLLVTGRFSVSILKSFLAEVYASEAT